MRRGVLLTTVVSLAVCALLSANASATVLTFETVDGAGNTLLGDVAASGISDFVPAPQTWDVPTGLTIRGRYAGWIITGSSNSKADGWVYYIDPLLGDRREPLPAGEPNSRVRFVFRPVQIGTVDGNDAAIPGTVWCDPAFLTLQPTPFDWMVNTWTSAPIYAECEGWRISTSVGSIKPDKTVIIDPLCGNRETSSPGVTQLLFRFRAVVIDTVDQHGNHRPGEVWSDSQFTTPRPTPFTWRANTAPTGQLHGRCDGVELATAFANVVPDTTWWVDPDGNTGRTPTPGTTAVLFVYPQVSPDTEPPVTSASFVSGAGGVVAEITAYDLPDPDNSGVKEIHYLFDSDPEVVVAGDSVQFAVTGDGRHTLEAWAVDNAGNVGAHVTAETLIDTQGPVTSAAFVTGAGGVSAEITAHDLPDPDNSGVKEIHYLLDANPEVVVMGDSVSFPVTGGGRHTLEAWAVDNAGNVGAHVSAETQGDVTPPVIRSVIACPKWLWPVDGKLHSVKITVDAVDDTDLSPTSKITGVTSDEDRLHCHSPKKTQPDWLITGDLTVKLRAERNPHGRGRTYTITVQCADRSGNTSTATVEVKVPRQWSHKRGWKRGDGGCRLSLTSAAALPTLRGAEIVYGLSAPADVSVTVLNIAGRPVRRIVADRPAAAGINSLVWDGVSDAGLAVPNGMYLVEVVANGADGSASRAVAALALNR